MTDKWFERTVIGVGCGAIGLWLLFWGAVIFIALHFILKAW